MTIDWQKVAASYERDLLTDLKALIAIPSVRDVEHKTAEAPLGPAPAQALNAMLEIAKRDGFDTFNVENVAGRISFGQGETKLGLLGHVDVVPAGDGWDSEPFVAKIQDGRIYGRGSADDKGPTLAAYYALRLLKDQGITPKQTVQFIIGTDEESNWYGMDRYQATQPMPDYGFSPDAEFPIINGEKGISTLTLTFAAQPTSGHTSMTAFDAGLRVNMVPQSATASLTGNLPDDWQAQSDAYAQANNVKISYADTADGVQFTAVGFGAHALEPSAGINAATHLATLLAPWVDDPAGHLYLQTIADHLHNDSRGHHLAIAFSDAIMGDLTASADLFTFRPNGEQTIAINVRYPQGIDLATIQANMQQALGDAVTVSITEAGHTPHYVSGDDPLVKTLLQVYQDHTGHDGREQSIGGGTYGRIMKRGVAFGAMMPGRENVMHQANEYMPIEDIMHAVAIYADAIYRLTQTEAL